jgi:hypothetical protein
MMQNAGVFEEQSGEERKKESCVKKSKNPKNFRLRQVE